MDSGEILMKFLRQIWILNQLLIIVMAEGNSTSSNSAFFTNEMVTGLSMGFGFIIGFITIVCIIWCLCCGSGCRKSDAKKGRVGPSPSPRRTAPSTRSTTANTYSTGGGRGSRRS